MLNAQEPLLLQTAENLEIGRRGEEWVAARERQKLAGTPHANCVTLCPHTRSSSFDIQSRTTFGAPLYLEVKTTAGDWNTPFYMTGAEYAFANHCLSNGLNYELHRVYHVFDEQLRGEIVYSAQDVMAFFEADPAICRLKRRELTAGPDRYLQWEESADRIPGTRCRLYMARIEGPDATYRFARQFQRGTYEYSPNTIRLSCDIESTGVYEVSAVWTDGNGIELQRQRTWFLLINGDAYDLTVHDVLRAVDELKRRAS